MKENDIDTLLNDLRMATDLMSTTSLNDRDILEFSSTIYNEYLRLKANAEERRGSHVNVIESSVINRLRETGHSKILRDLLLIPSHGIIFFKRCWGLRYRAK